MAIKRDGRTAWTGTDDLLGAPRKPIKKERATPSKKRAPRQSKSADMDKLLRQAESNLDAMLVKVEELNAQNDARGRRIAELEQVVARCQAELAQQQPIVNDHQKMKVDYEQVCNKYERCQVDSRHMEKQLADAHKKLADTLQAAQKPARDTELVEVVNTFNARLTEVNNKLRVSEETSAKRLNSYNELARRLEEYEGPLAGRDRPKLAKELMVANERIDALQRQRDEAVATSKTRYHESGPMRAMLWTLRSRMLEALNAPTHFAAKCQMFHGLYKEVFENAQATELLGKTKPAPGEYVAPGFVRMIDVDKLLAAIDQYKREFADICNCDSRPRDKWWGACALFNDVMAGIDRHFPNRKVTTDPTATDHGGKVHPQP